MKQLEVKTFTYRYNKDFLIDITVSKGGIYESWIYLDGYGFKLYMFGLYCKDIDEYLNILECDSKNIYYYMQEYIDIKDKMEEDSFSD